MSEWRHMQKAVLVREARDLARETWGPPVLGGRCALVSLALMAVAFYRYSRRLTLQAGTLQWRFRLPENDDGRGPTHFTYLYNPEHPLSAERLRQGALPEIHVWLGDVERQELVDPTTGDLPEHARRFIGVAWETRRPPDFLWAPIAEVPDDASYQPSEEATKTAGRILLGQPMEELMVVVRRRGWHKQPKGLPPVLAALLGQMGMPPYPSRP